VSPRPRSPVYWEPRVVFRRACIERAIARGLCRQCFKPRGGDGSPTMCRPCLAKAGGCNKSRRERRRASGQCVACGHDRGGVDKVTSGTETMCRPCSDRVNAKTLYGQRTRYRSRRAAGLCTSCPSPRGSDGTAKECRRCADKSNERKRLNRARRKGLGLAPRDGLAGTRTGRPASSPAHKGGGAW
jgi:hypothetical protein